MNFEIPQQEKRIAAQHIDQKNASLIYETLSSNSEALSVLTENLKQKTNAMKSNDLTMWKKVIGMEKDFLKKIE